MFCVFKVFLRANAQEISFQSVKWVEIMCVVITTLDILWKPTAHTVTDLNTFQLSFNTCPFSTTFLIPFDCVVKVWIRAFFVIALEAFVSRLPAMWSGKQRRWRKKKHPRHTVTSAQSLNHSLLCQTRRAALSLWVPQHCLHLCLLPCYTANHYQGTHTHTNVQWKIKLQGCGGECCLISGKLFSRFCIASQALRDHQRPRLQAFHPCV